MPGRAIDVRGLDDFRRALRHAGSGWPRELAKTHQIIAKEVAVEGRAFARGYGGSTGHFASSIYGTGSTARAALSNRKDANAAIWGAKKHAGWYARRRYRNSLGKQFPKWVGNDWEPGGHGGPRGINDAIRHDLPHIDDRYLDMIEKLAHRAFPD